ncbi:type II toxin-antitoxin system RelE/ParE family toxin [Lamprobacter modestohalophilus]|uniref:type II toxin-antitoxin system RelE/ParE family toxin n=1 Tax=Lamprobacter modestohalophilus TaxID=1064514 RepID=UPI002ADEAF0E|nr:type II toxin-antitoxin system RelE/ParE family toxin [Lamprobacter modestohalophilus]MEA1051566.1 type II toxin-antitoxin system RelE/ParE family toxin [Lamprobacter modestohalophilus]
MLIIRPEAETDIQMAYRWYEDSSPGLGQAIVDELDDLFQRLETHPKLYSEVMPDIRRALTRRFPYAVYYTLHRSDLIVLAVLHQRRKPEQWHSRLPS